MDLKEAIIDQRKDLEGTDSREKLVTRVGLDRARSMIEHPNIVVITGVRRCGKSIFSYLLAKDDRFGYVNFDDERFLRLRAEDLNDVIKTFYELYGDVTTIILDEIQNIEGWELFASRLRMSKRVIITGSNSELLSGELASRLTGRYVGVALFPFSFSEYLDLKGSAPSADLGTLERAKILNSLMDYIQKGGFPEVYKFGNSILPSIYENIVTKDVVLRYGIRKPQALRQLAKYLISNYSEEFTYNRLSKILDVKRNETISTWIGYLEEAYLIFHLERFDYKLKQQFKSPKKIYCIDTGFISKIGFSNSQNMGHLMENVVAVELMRRKSQDEEFDIYYWKDYSHNEVDFVIRYRDLTTNLIQVTYANDRNDIRSGEMNSLETASVRLRCKNIQVITWDYEDNRISNGLNIVFIPLWKWLLKK